MFEKEAVEQANKKYPIPRVSNELDFARNRKYEEGFKDGATFGYNKAKEKLDKAKEIIKNLIGILEFVDGEQTRELKTVKEAEQFLNE